MAKISSAKKELDMSTLWGGTASSADTHPRAAWFRASKYAMFIHWGLYSEAGGMWNGTAWHGISEWMMRRARIPVREYETLAARFNPTDFNADDWARLAKAAGMRYLVLTSKHHEGFAMFKSKASPFNIVDATPFKRDPIAELSAACKKHGLGLGFYYSQFLDWHERDAAGNDWEFSKEQVPDKDFNRYLYGKAIPQITELLTNYGDIALIWFDTPGSITRQACEELQALIRRLQPKCLINSRIGNGLGDYSSLGDQEVPLTGPAGLWETCDTHNDTWAYSVNDHHWKSPTELLSRLVRVVSLGGTYLLNVGPTGKGIIPESSAEILRRAGAWLKRNGEAVYETTRSLIPAQAWGVTTAKPGKLYLHILNWPTRGTLLVPGIKGVIKKASILSTGELLAVSRKQGVIAITIPLLAPEKPHTVIVLDMPGGIKGVASAFSVYPDLMNHLPAPFAKLTDCTLAKKAWMEKFGDWHHTQVVHQIVTGSVIEWHFNSLGKGLLNLSLEYDCLPEGDASEFELTLGANRWRFPVFCTGNRHANRFRFRTECLGVVEMAKAGPAVLKLEAMSINDAAALSIAKVTLDPIG